jgi:hypothetical protein
MPAALRWRRMSLCSADRRPAAAARAPAQRLTAPRAHEASGRPWDRRRNWIEIQTTRLVSDHDLIAVESLNVKGMVRRPNPKPDPAAPGAFLPNGASAKNRSIHRQGWSQWLRRLDEKAQASGVHVARVDPRRDPQPLDSPVFIADLQQRPQAALCRLDDAIRSASAGGVRIGTKHGKPWIFVPPLAKLPNAPNLPALHAEIERRHAMIDLLECSRRQTTSAGSRAS